MITIVDYDAGNLRSVKRACDAVGVDSVITQDPEAVASAERIIFPGVGAAPHAMDVLHSTGLDQALKTAFAKGTPILGICLGTQIILESSEEGDVACLGLIPGATLRFQLQDPMLKIPHMGWNAVEPVKAHPLLAGIEKGDEFYFVHSFYPHPADEKNVFAITEYEKPFCCAMGRDNLFATQFHPEKSGRFGLRILGEICEVGCIIRKAIPMLSKRLISCLDVRNGKLAKSVKFVDTRDIGDPIEKAREYYEDGLDELVFYDITASSDARDIMIDVVERVASQIFIPFSVGGGIRSVADATRLRLAGAEKVNVNSAAVKRPELIREIADAIGNQSTILSMDVLRVEKTQAIPSGYEIVINGGRTPMGIDALEWARRGVELGAGELVVNSIDADGTKEGYELTLTRMIVDAVGVPVIASGGAGKPEHLYDVLTQGGADAALVASMVHYGEYTVHGLKEYLHGRGVHMRMRY